LSPERWRQVKEIASDVCDLSVDERPAAVEARCGSDPELRREVDAFLSTLEYTPEAFLKLGEKAASAKTGEIINDRYAIVRELARTPSNAVYLANDLQLLNKPAVLKTSIGSGYQEAAG
jgi:hypothetical protein